MIGVNCIGSYGRLGNQMFQYATGYALARKHNTSIVIPSQEIYGSTNGNQLIKTFNLKSAHVDGNWKELRFQYNEPNFSFHDSVLNLPNNTNIVGYFQSEKYFLPYKKDLQTSEFVFKDDIVFKSSPVLDNLLERANGKKLCSIHVRLGDYTKLTNVHNNLSLEYYEAAFKQLVTENTHCLIFSDDIKLANKILKKAGYINLENADFVDTEYDVTLYLMSKCDMHIIANSSFSWWGAWLSDSKNVVAPKKWFEVDGPKHWEDIYCKDWTVL